MIGDEMAYPAVRRAHVQKLFGEDPQADIPLAQIIDEVREKSHFFFCIPGGAAHGGDQSVLDFWISHLDQSHVIKLDKPDDTSECIAMTIGLTEGVITLDQAQQHLASRGRVGSALDSLVKVIKGLFGGGPPSDSASGTRRL
jgi:hypothetical protein